MMPDVDRDGGDLYISLASYRARRRVEALLGTLPWLCSFRRRGPKAACTRIADADWPRVESIPGVTRCRRCVVSTPRDVCNVKQQWLFPLPTQEEAMGE